VLAAGDSLVITGSRRADVSVSDDEYFLTSILNRVSANFD
jgi:hypothetical protein